MSGRQFDDEADEAELDALVVGALSTLVIAAILTALCVLGFYLASQA